VTGLPLNVVTEQASAFGGKQGSNERVDSKKKSIEEMTEHTADVIGTRIKTPLDQGPSVQGMARQRLKRTDKPL